MQCRIGSAGNGYGIGTCGLATTTPSPLSSSMAISICSIINISGTHRKRSRIRTINASHHPDRSMLDIKWRNFHVLPAHFFWASARNFYFISKEEREEKTRPSNRPTNQNIYTFLFSIWANQRIKEKTKKAQEKKLTEKNTIYNTQT